MDRPGQASASAPLPLWRRGGIGTLVVLVHALLLVMLLRLASPPASFGRPGGPITVTLLPDAEAERDTARTTRRSRSAAARPAQPAEEQPAPPRDPPPPPPLPPSAAAAIWSQVMPLSRSEFAAGDVARVPAARGAGQLAEAGGSGTGDDDADDGARGPNGERLYNAEWFRKPTDAELAAYLPANRPRNGWGMVACQTVSGNRVEDCVEIGQSPPGSGLSRAVRQAAWQFRVLPPRVGGRPQVGAWVRIRIDYGVRAAE